MTEFIVGDYITAIDDPRSVGLIDSMLPPDSIIVHWFRPPYGSTAPYTGKYWTNGSWWRVLSESEVTLRLLMVSDEEIPDDD